MKAESVIPRTLTQARDAMREILARSGLSMRALSAAMGRDADYVAAFLDPRRATRARPTPNDLLAASDATGIPFVELLDAIWGIPADRLAAELGLPDDGNAFADALRGLAPAQRAQVLEYARFLAQRKAAPRPEG